MNASCTRPITAISKMAVIFNLLAITSVLAIASLLVFTGCVTKRDIEEVKRQLTTVESQNRNTQGMVARMDSIIAAGADADNKLRNEMRITLDDVGRQIARLLENYNDLQQQLDRMTRDQVPHRHRHWMKPVLMRTMFLSRLSHTTNTKKRLRLSGNISINAPMMRT